MLENFKKKKDRKIWNVQKQKQKHILIPIWIIHQMVRRTVVGSVATIHDLGELQLFSLQLIKI
jgi:hypothetical protein